MATIFSNRKLPNRTLWQDRHDRAVRTPNGEEQGLVHMISGWQHYALRYTFAFKSHIGDDGVLGPAWEAIGDSLRTLLNGETGRLDAGTLDGTILQTMEEEGIDVSQK